MLKDEVVDFFNAIPPFNFLPPENLYTIASVVSLEYFPRGDMIIKQGGPAIENLHIIKKGGVKVYVNTEENEELVIDFRGEGESFGMISLVSEDRSRTSITAIEDTICYLLPRQTVLEMLQKHKDVNEYFLKSFFINFIDKTSQKAKSGTYGKIDDEGILFTTPLKEIVRKSPLTADNSITIQTGAKLMTDNKISSLIVVDQEKKPLGIVTDRDLREKVVAGGIEVSRNISEVMSQPLYTVDGEEYCFEALLQMMRHNIHHIMITEGGRLSGVVTNHDFMVLQGSSPASLVKEIEKIHHLDELHQSSPRFYKAVASLLSEGAKGHNLSGFITELIEKVIISSIRLVEEKIGPPPLPYSLFWIGDGGRRELTLTFQVQLGIVYEDPAPDEKESVKEYFVKLAATMNESLCQSFTVCKRCFSREQVLSNSEWQGLFKKWCKMPELVQVELYEMRAIYGSDERVSTLREYLIQKTLSSLQLMDEMKLLVANTRPPIGFYKKYVVAQNGEHLPIFNVYELGIKPLIDAVRILSLSKGSGGNSTLNRCRNLKSRGVSQVEDIETALDYLLENLIGAQLAQVNQNRQPDNCMEPDSLAGLERKMLKGTFQLIEKLFNEYLGNNNHTDMV